MKILATSDTHFSFDSTDWPDADVFIHAGDLMYEGLVAEWAIRQASLTAVNAPVKIYVPGNHDYYPFHYEGLAASQLRKEAGVIMARPHKPVITLPNQMKMLCVPYVGNLPGWAYNVSDEWLADWLTQATSGHTIDVVVSHAPPKNILDAIEPLASTTKRQNHVGSKALRWWWNALDIKPLVWICGHIHESYGSEMKDGTHFYNVAQCDGSYKQVNDPVLITL